ncbi:hypothetical protein HPB50_027227 [Hyalomma asiaticum]|uniref:Uncharacterized protein n=1 Tax=Hyalomma asiaticum TaxID=266040 RepID=A0ACB7TP51_HYAAI|nr:hypothetical protein HPB50_027227 [Hyalomma asiaticum]
MPPRRVLVAVSDGARSKAKPPGQPQRRATRRPIVRGVAASRAPQEMRPRDRRRRPSLGRPESAKAASFFENRSPARVGPPLPTDSLTSHRASARDLPYVVFAAIDR